MSIKFISSGKHCVVLYTINSYYTVSKSLIEMIGNYFSLTWLVFAYPVTYMWQPLLNTVPIHGGFIILTHDVIVYP